ncbi:MAG: hypothetical protein GKR89_26680 [Candidatus Latescibacteria bacterium]|nr:hypothetical protein [Candidatus Latescibacterota bacterium]
MLITCIELDAVHVNHRGDWLFVRLQTDAGLEGLGEMKAGRNYGQSVAALRRLGQQLQGLDPAPIEALIHRFKAGDADHINALCAIEQALWDLAGKKYQVPLHVLLGGPCRGDIRLYANINRATTDRTPEGFARNAQAAVAEGFDAVKLAPFDGLPAQTDSAQQARQGIACMEAVRQAIGPDIDLLVDCHSRFSLKGALEVAQALRPLDLYWFEQPVPESDREACLAVKDQCGMTIAGGESRRWRSDFAEVCQYGTMDVIMPDVKLVGGIGELKKVGEMAAAWDIPTAPHGPSGPVSQAAGVEAMLALPQFLILEYGWGEVPWRPQLVEPAETIVKGRLKSSGRPGLGLELNPDMVEAHRVALD